MKAPAIVGVLPGAGWVIEHRETATVLPLVGWGVTVEGEIEPLPRSLGDGWRARPAHPDDAAAIRRSALNQKGRQKSGPFGVFQGGIDDELTGRLL